MARLYRKSLKTLCSWVIDREIFIEEANSLRGRFDAERGMSNAKAIRLLKVGGNFFFVIAGIIVFMLIILIDSVNFDVLEPS